MRSHEPCWLTRPMLLAVQRGSLVDRHQAIVEAALAGPRRLHERDPSTDLATLAASYATTLAQTHGFMAGSKRSAFLAAYIFLGLNGYEINAPEPEVIRVLENLATRRMDASGAAEWLRSVATLSP